MTPRNEKRAHCRQGTPPVVIMRPGYQKEPTEIKTNAQYKYNTSASKKKPTAEGHSLRVKKNAPKVSAGNPWRKTTHHTNNNAQFIKKTLLQTRTPLCVKKNAQSINKNPMEKTNTPYK
jgi:hypothetical protein